MAEHFGRFEQETKTERQENEPHLLDSFPWGDTGLAKYGKWNNDREKSSIAKDIIYTFLDQELRNTEIYESQEGTAFPWTVIRVKEIAKTLLERYGNLPAAKLETPSAAEGIARKEFVMTSSLTTFNGHPFTFSEEAIHQTFRALPGAIQAIEEGREPQDTEIYTLGSPTNELGAVSGELSKEIEQNPFGALGKLYAQFVEAQAVKNRDESKRMEIISTGISMGSNMAAETAKILLDRGEVTQTRKANSPKNLPHLTVNMYVPAGLNESALRKLQIPAGFAAESAYQLAGMSGMAKIALSEKSFIKKIEKIYEQRGIKPRMDSEQRKFKVKALHDIVRKLIGGVPVPENVSANEIIGLEDPTMFSLKRTREAKQRRAESGNTLRGAMLKRTNPNRRKFAVNMTHNIPFYRESEFKRWDKTVELLKGLRDAKAIK